MSAPAGKNTSPLEVDNFINNSSLKDTIKKPDKKIKFERRLLKEVKDKIYANKLTLHYLIIVHKKLKALDEYKDLKSEDDFIEKFIEKYKIPIY